ncbi:MAG: hypothetical protein AB1468_03240 [Candidatus Micrarchaeota archaeon]
MEGLTALEHRLAEIINDPVVSGKKDEPASGNKTLHEYLEYVKYHLEIGNKFAADIVRFDAFVEFGSADAAFVRALGKMESARIEVYEGIFLNEVLKSAEEFLKKFDHPLGSEGAGVAELIARRFGADTCHRFLENIRANITDADIANADTKSLARAMAGVLAGGDGEKQDKLEKKLVPILEASREALRNDPAETIKGILKNLLVSRVESRINHAISYRKDSGWLACAIATVIADGEPDEKLVSKLEPLLNRKHWATRRLMAAEIADIFRTFVRNEDSGEPSRSSQINRKTAQLMKFLNECVGDPDLQLTADYLSVDASRFSEEFQTFREKNTGKYELTDAKLKKALEFVDKFESFSADLALEINSARTLCVTTAVSKFFEHPAELLRITNVARVVEDIKNMTELVVEETPKKTNQFRNKVEAKLIVAMREALKILEKNKANAPEAADITETPDYTLLRIEEDNLVKAVKNRRESLELKKYVSAVGREGRPYGKGKKKALL